MHARLDVKFLHGPQNVFGPPKPIQSHLRNEGTTGVTGGQTGESSQEVIPELTLPKSDVRKWKSMAHVDSGS